MVEIAEKYDVAIVGAGPAGSSAAIRLANAGLKVLLVEKAHFPREKLCGEFISPECIPHFEELGVFNSIAAAPQGTALLRTMFFGRGGNAISVESSWFGHHQTAAIGLSRAQMDLKLLERARACGATVRDATAAGLITENGAVTGIELKDSFGMKTNARTDLTIDATGRSRALARQFEPEKTKKPAKYVAFKTHLQGVGLTPQVCEIYAYPGGYGGCNRVEGDFYNLCFIASASETKRLGSDPERVMRELVFTNRRAAEVLQDASVAKPWLAVPIDSFGRGSLVPAGGLITVGDAAAFIDPFTGSGILLALESARIASAAIIESFRTGFEFHDLSRSYKQNYAAAFDRRLYACSLLRHAAFAPFLAETIIRVLGLSTALRRRVARATR
jgi:menaquinone-9 beta-reductase